MISHPMVDELLSQPDVSARREVLRGYVATAETADVETLAEALKDEVLRKQQANIGEALAAVTALKLLANVTQEDRHRALALRMEAQTRMIGLGEYQESLPLFDQALATYRELGDEVGEATTEVTHIWALATLGQYDEALERASWAEEILSSAKQWRIVAVLNLNMAAIAGRLSRDMDALACLDASRSAYMRSRSEDDEFLIGVEINRSVVLRTLGRFDEAIKASEESIRLSKRVGRLASEARGRQSLGVIYFVLGRYNEALKSLDDARELFHRDGRDRDSVMVDLFISDCLLQLRRFPEVVAKSAAVRKLFTKKGTRIEVGQSWLNEGVALLEMGQPDRAVEALQNAKELFIMDGNLTWASLVDLQGADLELVHGEPSIAYEMALSAATYLKSQDVLVAATQGRLVAARAAIALGHSSEAKELAQEALVVGLESNVPLLSFRAYQILGRLEADADRASDALAYYDLAIAELENLQSRIITEFRAAFVEDKLSPYEDAALVCLQHREPERGLDYVERAKARALLDLISQRMDLSVNARSPEDQPIVDELEQLRRQREQLVRRAAINAENITHDIGSASARYIIPPDVLQIESRMTELWHKLLVRNSAYARDASLWQVHTEPVLPYLAEDEALVEYFTVGGQFFVIIATCNCVDWRPLAVESRRLDQLLSLFSLNQRTFSRASDNKTGALIYQSRAILKELHASLWEPLMDLLGNTSRIIIVPHGNLHYLPFHALFDGRQFLIELFEISYLPGASFLRYGEEFEFRGHGALVAASSWNGTLVHTSAEAKVIADLWHTIPYLEEELTLDVIRNEAPQANLLHFATHGDFRADNPLFSGLSVADGWLTTLDIFGLSLSASLTTLSACQTGRSVVGGGDELFGLMRAFLTAGTASLLMTLWPVDDSVTLEWMTSFYSFLATGETKGSAVRNAQLELIHSPTSRFQHPFYWAPFFLVGASGLL